MGKLIDETGNRYGRLTVIRRGTRERKSGMISWLCACDCGKQTTVYGSYLRNGDTKSCGCLNIEHAIKIGALNGMGYTSVINGLFARYKINAHNRRHDFALSKEEFTELIGRRCFYCGALPSNTAKNSHGTKEYKYNGIDRVDTTRGYSSDNCVACCKDCNYKKSDATPLIIRRAYEFLATRS